MAVEEGVRALPEGGDGLLVFVGQDLAVGESGVVVDCVVDQAVTDDGGLSLRASVRLAVDSITAKDWNRLVAEAHALSITNPHPAPSWGSAEKFGCNARYRPRQ
jgi:hypothetical protein